MRMQGKLRAATDRTHAGKANRMDADHQAGSARIPDEVGVSLHRVDFVDDVESIHHLLAGSVRMLVRDPHNRRDSLGERVVRAIGLKLVLLDEVDSTFSKLADHRGRLFGTEAYAWLNDGANQRTRLEPGQVAGPRDAERGPGTPLCELRREADLTS